MVAPPPAGGLSSIPTCRYKKGPEDKRKVTIKGGMFALVSAASLSILYCGQNFNIAAVSSAKLHLAQGLTWKSMGKVLTFAG